MARSILGVGCVLSGMIFGSGVRLSESFPRIAAAAQSLDTSVFDVCSFGGRWEWSIPLRVQLRGGAMEEWSELLLHLASLHRNVLTERPAHIVWPLETNGCFSVASLRLILVEKVFKGTPDFPHKLIWCSKIPSKISAFCLRVFHRKIATLDNLQRRGFVLANWCSLCCSCLESVDHIFLHCAFASEVWSQFSSTLSMHGPLLGDVVGLFQVWKGMNCLQAFAPTLEVLLHAFLWFIWKERNDRIFSDLSNPPARVFRKMWYSVVDWLLFSGSVSPSTASGWRRVVFDNG
ncbi:hypothetical protein LINPERHAP1_LOCUS24773 [Linum perenne]